MAICTPLRWDRRPSSRRAPWKEPFRIHCAGRAIGTTMAKGDLRCRCSHHNVSLTYEVKLTTTEAWQEQSQAFTCSASLATVI